MVYLIALPIAALLYHSLHALSGKYYGREPFWLHVYALICLIYIVGVPSLFVLDIVQKIGLSDITAAWSAGIIGTVILIVLINTAPTKRRRGRGETKEWS